MGVSKSRGWKRTTRSKKNAIKLLRTRSAKNAGNGGWSLPSTRLLFCVEAGGKTPTSE